MRKPTFRIRENKGTVTAKLISTFVFATQIECFLSFPNPKLLTSSHLMCMYSLVCVELVQKPHCWFSHDAAHIMEQQE